MYLFLFCFSFWVKCVAEFLSQLRVFFFLKYQEHKWHFANFFVGIYHRTLRQFRKDFNSGICFNNRKV